MMMEEMDMQMKDMSRIMKMGMDSNKEMDMMKQRKEKMDKMMKDMKAQ